jgi:hypothetical protein
MTLVRTKNERGRIFELKTDIRCGNAFLKANICGPSLGPRHAQKAHHAERSPRQAAPQGTVFKTERRGVMANINQRRGNRGKLSFKERDMARLVRAVRAAGLQPTGAEAIIKDGGTTLRVLTATDNDDNSGVNPWDGVLTNAANKKRIA